MSNQKRLWDNFIICFVAGIFLTAVSALLYILLGEESIFIYHDQLDGEVLSYIYQAKYLFQNVGIAELMNGVSKTALTAPAPLFVLLYKVFEPYAAFVICQYISMIAAFAGMYLLLTKWKVKPLTAGLCGVLFAYLPLLPVYGLSMYGVPLACYAFLCLAEKKKMILSLVLLVIFGSASSLVLSGFAVSMAAVVFGIVVKKVRVNGRYWIGTGVLVLTYGCCNWSLFAQILGFGVDYVTHKEELKIYSTSFWNTVWNIFLNGAEHAQSYQKWIVALALVIVLIGSFRKELRNLQWKTISVLCGVAFLIAVLCGLYNCEWIVNIRRQIGGVAVWFQLDRIYWLYPAIWYAILGLCLEWIWQSKKIVLGILGVACFIVTAATVLLAGNWKSNVKKFLNNTEPGITWQDFYAEDVYAQVEAYIKKTTGREKDEYRVISLGICPGAALYNGFYCLDGYSNNYSLEYKHAFREIIAPQLEQSEYLKEYFDAWGNRCYLFSAQIPGYYTVEKGGFYFTDFSMNTEAFKALGGKYVFSAGYIDNAENTGLKLACEQPFETEESYYRIYIYELIDSYKNE